MLSLTLFSQFKDIPSEWVDALLATVEDGRLPFSICRDSRSNVCIKKRKNRVRFLRYQDRAFFHFLSMQCMSGWLRRSKRKQSLLTSTNSLHPGGSHRPERRCQVSTWAYLWCAVLRHDSWGRTILFSRWESAANRTRTQLGLLGAILLDNHPYIQSKAKAKRMDLCGLIFPCLWLHACMSRWWSQCGDGPVEVSCSVSLSLSWLWALWMGCKSESSGGRYPPEPPARRLMVPWPPPQSFLCRLAFSLAFLVF